MCVGGSEAPGGYKAEENRLPQPQHPLPTTCWGETEDAGRAAVRLTHSLRGKRKKSSKVETFNLLQNLLLIGGPWSEVFIYSLLATSHASPSRGPWPTPWNKVSSRTHRPGVRPPGVQSRKQWRLRHHRGDDEDMQGWPQCRLNSSSRSCRRLCLFFNRQNKRVLFFFLTDCCQNPRSTVPTCDALQEYAVGEGSSQPLSFSSSIRHGWSRGSFRWLLEGRTPLFPPKLSLVSGEQLGVTEDSQWGSEQHIPLTAPHQPMGNLYLCGERAWKSWLLVEWLVS